MLTVDTPVAGARCANVRNGMTVPPQLTLRTFVDGATHPRWWFDLLTTEPLSFASLTSSEGTVGELIERVFDPAPSRWPTWNGARASGRQARGQGRAVGGDAQRVVAAGADGVLRPATVAPAGRAPVPLELVPSVREAVGAGAPRCSRHRLPTGADVVAAIAMGAHAALVGRAYLYG